MILPNATLFPQALLPLYIYEPRYRRMLSDSLHSHRLFAVAMQRPGAAREQPVPVAGLGVVRVSVEHKDATSHVILQGIARIRLREAARYKPYRKHHIEVLETPPSHAETVDALADKLRGVLEHRLKLGVKLPFPAVQGPGAGHSFAPEISAGDVLKFLGGIRNPEHLADMVTCAILPDAGERQAILETVEVDRRLRRLIHFLLADLQRHQENHGHE